MDFTVTENKSTDPRALLRVSLAVGNSPDFRDTASNILKAIVRNLGCAAALLLRRHGDDVPRSCAYAIPERIEKNPIVEYVLHRFHEQEGRRPAPFVQFKVRGARKRETLYFYIMDLCKFGSLVLVKRATPLENSVLKEFGSLNTRIDDALMFRLEHHRLRRKLELAENRERDLRVRAAGLLRKQRKRRPRDGSPTAQKRKPETTEEYLRSIRRILSQIETDLALGFFDSIGKSGRRIQASASGRGLSRLARLGELLNRAAERKQIDLVRALRADVELFLISRACPRSTAS